MEIQVLTPEIKAILKKDVFLKAKLAAFNQIGIWSLDQWRLKNNPMLTTLDNLKIIREHLKYDDAVVLTEALEVAEEGAHT